MGLLLLSRGETDSGWRRRGSIVNSGWERHCWFDEIVLNDFFFLMVGITEGEL
jgi:hypothetical protein